PYVPAAPQQCPTPPAAVPQPPLDLKPVPMPPAPKEPAAKEPAAKEPAAKEPAAAPEAPPPSDQAPSTDAFSQAPPAGTAEGGSFAPNMFGDQFGAGRGSVTIQRPPIVIPAVPGTPGVQLRLGGAFSGASKGGSGPLAFSAQQINNLLTFTT